MDKTYRLKMKIGQHEFEADGPADVVQQQFEAFKQMVTLAASTRSPELEPIPEGKTAAVIPTAKPTTPNAPINAASLSKIMRTEDRIISLTVRPGNAEDAVLLILYGQRELRQNDSVSGFEVMEGMTSTGGFSVTRVDRLLAKLADDGDVIVIGQHRGKRYRLTNAGHARAAYVAESMVANVP